MVLIWKSNGKDSFCFLKVIWTLLQLVHKAISDVYQMQWRSQNEAEDAMLPYETNFLRYLLLPYIHIKLLENKR